MAVMAPVGGDDGTRSGSGGRPAALGELHLTDAASTALRRALSCRRRRRRRRAKDKDEGGARGSRKGRGGVEKEACRGLRGERIPTPTLSRRLRATFSLQDNAGDGSLLRALVHPFPRRCPHGPA